MVAITKIAHLADIHLRRATSRHQEYREVFNELILSLKQQKPDRIVIVGDLFNDYIKIEGELLILASEFLTNLANIAPVRITRGNHDINKSDLSRVDSIQALVDTMRNSNIIYYNETGLYKDENVIWAVWHHGNKNNNPWPKTTTLESNDSIFIDLFHDPINGATNSEGWEFKSKTYRDLDAFKGQLSLFGDIHKLQYFSQNKTKAYSSSLIEQNFGEGDNQFHGYLLWDLKTLQAKEIPIKNNYGYYNVVLNRFTDFDNLNIDIKGSPNKRIRVIWRTLPAARTTENERKVVKYLQVNYNMILLKHLNDFVEEEKIDIQQKEDIENIFQIQVVHKIITEYLEKIGVEPDIIEEVIKLDTEIHNRLTIEQVTNIQWTPLILKGTNFRSFGKINLNFINKEGLYQIVGENGGGKTSAISLLSYILWGESLETDFRAENGFARFVNKANGATFCDGTVVIECDNQYFAIKRTSTIKYTKQGEISKVPTTVEYHVLKDPLEELTKENSIETLNEEQRTKTQKKIEEIIGSFMNFVRITLTTADTLNKVLSNEKSIFIDSILNDSGTNIFDLRLTEFKNYKKEVIAKNRVHCDVLKEENNISTYQETIKTSQENIVLNTAALKVTNDSIVLDEAEKDKLLLTMHQIDTDLSSTNEEEINKTIYVQVVEKDALLKEEINLNTKINSMLNEYDSTKLEACIHSKDVHKSKEFELRTNINNIKSKIEQVNSSIYRLNGDIENLKRDGANKKKKIADLNDSKICSECGQTIEKEEHKEHIRKTIAIVEKEMYGIADVIKQKQLDKLVFEAQIQTLNTDIGNINKTIETNDKEFQKTLEEIGILSNQKQEVEKRRNLVRDLENYPLRIENVNLKIKSLQDKLKLYNDQKIKIEQNNLTQKNIATLNTRLLKHKNDKQHYEHLISKDKSQIELNNRLISDKENLIEAFKKQEKYDNVLKLYENSVYRDGIPTQILTNILLPKINNTISKLLENVEFSVWLDKDDLRLKFCYDSNPNGVIDAASASGMERSFSCIALKVALNQINARSKSTALFLDEIMGKLKGERVDQFVDFMKVITKFYKKVFIIEHNHEINPDYVIKVEKKNNISTIELVDDEKI